MFRITPAGPMTVFLSEPPERVMTRSAEPVIDCVADFYLWFAVLSQTPVHFFFLSSLFSGTLSNLLIWT